MASGLRGGVVRPRTWSSASSQGSPVRLWWDEKPEDSPPCEPRAQAKGAERGLSNFYPKGRGRCRGRGGLRHQRKGKKKEENKVTLYGSLVTPVLISHLCAVILHNSS